MPTVNIPGIGELVFPDTMTNDEIERTLQKEMPRLRKANYSKRLKDVSRERIAPVNPVEAPLIGAGRGLTQLGRGVSQLFGGISPEEQEKIQEETELYEKTPVGRGLPAATGEFLGETAPFAAVPVTGGLLLKAAQMGAIGGLIGGTQFLQPGQSRLSSTALGAGFGVATPLALKGAQKALGGVKNIGGALAAKMTGKPRSRIAEEVFQGVESPQQFQKTQEAAQRLGLKITPAEASGSTLAAKTQGRLGRTPEASLALENFGRARKVKEKNIIQAFLHDVAPPTSDVGQKIKTTSANLLNKKKEALLKAAKPLYDDAFSKSIPEKSAATLAKDPVIKRAIKKVETDPVWAKEVGDLPITSVKKLDMVKQIIDDMRQSALTQGNFNRARILKKSFKDLVGTIDSQFPEYAAARALYSTGAKPLEKLRASKLGKLAELPEQQLSRASKIIFDPQETNPKTLMKLRDEIYKESPEAWNSIVRAEMERRIQQVAGDAGGSQFFRQVLSKKRDFNQFRIALKNNKKALNKLKDMRKAFKDLIDVRTVKGTAGLAQTSLSKPRQPIEAILNFIESNTPGSFDKTAVEIITNPKWTKDFNKVMAARENKIKFLDRLSTLFNKVGVASSSAATNE